MQFFKPKLIECLHDYNRRTFVSDLAAGVTVGIVALPLAIGFGIASGVTPAQGLWTAIIAGVIISTLGGSKVQIGGPTGAFVPILAGIVAIHGYAGLALATVVAGIFLVVMFENVLSRKTQTHLKNAEAYWRTATCFCMADRRKIIQIHKDRITQKSFRCLKYVCRQREEY